MIQRASPAPTAYKVPERSGEVLIDPPVERLPAILDQALRGGWGGAEILGTPLGEFREQVRARALSIAGVPPDALSSAARLVVMGHQPVFFHPGVWFKFFLLTRLCQHLDMSGLYLLVDNDAPGPITAEIPSQGDQLTRHTETLLDLPGDVSLEAAPAPTEGQWQTFCGRVRRHLGTVAAGEMRACFETFVAGAARARTHAGTLGQFLAGARRMYEATAAPPGYAEVAVSALSETPEFAAFALHLLQDPSGFRRRYNASLDEYRRLHRLRSAANPFPNLESADGYEEAPFWIVRGGRRVSLFVHRDSDRLQLRTPADTLLDLPAGRAGVEALRASGVRIRPKALTFTMFARLCLADLFIHGVGGARYDRATNAVIGEVFGCAPPPYVVATATLMLPLAGTGGAVEDGRALERRLMDLQHNPERSLASPSEAQRRLIDQKWSLIRAVEQMRPGAERRAATHQIREINAQLAQGLADEIHRLQTKQATLGRSSAEVAATYRGYPFFLFDPARLSALAAASTAPA
ncbi:MAG TPA: hypothetical protein VFP86_00475 [bacterium]|nr:hypothetical protein [bacterium]